MRKLPFSILAGIAALSAAAPAAATVTINSGGSVTFDNTAGPNSVNIAFNGLGGDPNAVLTPGLNAVLTLTLNSIVGNTFNFGYSLQNTSTVANTRVSGFGFNVGPNITGISSTGVFNQFATNAQFASQGNAEACFHGGPGGCPQSNPGNSIGFGGTGSGTLALTFGSAQTSIVLDNFLDRYQGFSTTNILGGEVTSAVGRGTIPAVPEPGTWAMMLIGFGGIGYSMRRRRETTGLAQLA